MANITLLLFSSLVLCLTLFYFKRRWPDLDVIDIYIIYIALHFGIYPFIRGLYSGKGVVYDSSTSNPLVIGLVFIHLLLIVVIIRVVSAYLPTKIKDILKIKTLISKWESVNNLIVLSIYSLLILFQIISYWKYGVKPVIAPDDFAKIGSDLPYWLLSMRAIYNYLVLSVFIVLASKASMSQYRPQYFWIALIIIFIPFGAYFGRKPFVNIFVIGTIIWLIRREKKLIQFKYLISSVLMVFIFFLVSNVWQTYRSTLLAAGASFKEAPNPISAALNFNATLRNLKERPGTWEFNYLVFDRQIESSGKVSTNGEITREGLQERDSQAFLARQEIQSNRRDIS